MAAAKFIMPTDNGQTDDSGQSNDIENFLSNIKQSDLSGLTINITH